MQIINSNTICFKSNKENFDKERDGLKKNTVRKLDDAEKRGLNLWLETITLYRHPKIRIVLNDCTAFNRFTAFERTLTDITEWEGIHIFSWR